MWLFLEPKAQMFDQYNSHLMAAVRLGEIQSPEAKISVGSLDPQFIKGTARNQADDEENMPTAGNFTQGRKTAGRADRSDSEPWSMVVYTRAGHAMCDYCSILHAGRRKPGSVDRCRAIGISLADS